MRALSFEILSGMLEITGLIVLSEMRQRKTNSMLFHLCVELKIQQTSKMYQKEVVSQIEK